MNESRLKRAGLNPSEHQDFLDWAIELEGKALYIEDNQHKFSISVRKVYDRIEELRDAS